MLSTSAPTASCLACDPLMILSVSRQGKEMFYILRIQLNFIQWSSLAKERDISIFVIQNQTVLQLPFCQLKSNNYTTPNIQLKPSKPTALNFSHSTLPHTPETYHNILFSFILTIQNPSYKINKSWF